MAAWLCYEHVIRVVGRSHCINPEPRPQWTARFHLSASDAPWFSRIRSSHWLHCWSRCCLQPQHGQQPSNAL